MQQLDDRRDAKATSTTRRPRHCSAAAPTGGEPPAARNRGEHAAASELQCTWCRSAADRRHPQPVQTRGSPFPPIRRRWSRNRMGVRLATRYKTSVPVQRRLQADAAAGREPAPPLQSGRAERAPQQRPGRSRRANSAARLFSETVRVGNQSCATVDDRSPSRPPSRPATSRAGSSMRRRGHGATHAASSKPSGKNISARETSATFWSEPSCSQGMCARTAQCRVERQRRERIGDEQQMGDQRRIGQRRQCNACSGHIRRFRCPSVRKDSKLTRARSHRGPPNRRILVGFAFELRKPSRIRSAATVGTDRAGRRGDAR